jgi:hypothetical protein
VQLFCSVNKTSTLVTEKGIKSNFFKPVGEKIILHFALGLKSALGVC